MNSLNILSIKKMPNFLQRVWFQINDFLFYQLFVIILIDNYEKFYIWIIYMLLTLFSLKSCFSSKNRIILKIHFENDSNLLQIEYIYIFKTKNISIPFKFVNFTYKRQPFGRLKTPYTLTLYENKKIVAQLIEGVSFGWDSDQIDNIIRNLNSFTSTSDGN